MSDMFSRSNVYIMLDALMDIDFGMIMTIREEFPNNKLIEYDIYKYTDNQIRRTLLNRVHENPLCLVMWEYSNDLYMELYDTYREKIYNKSNFTNIVNMLITTRRLDNINITIVCKDLKDKHFIETQHGDVMGSYKTILYDDLSLSHNDYIFANKASDIIKRKDIAGTNLYLFKSMYNLQYNKEDKLHEMRPHVEEVTNIAVVKYLSPYLMDDSYNIERNDINEQ